MLLMNGSIDMIGVEGRQGAQINQNISRGSREENWMTLEIISIYRSQGTVNMQCEVRVD
jgi:hypothetical protein